MHIISISLTYADLSQQYLWQIFHGEMIPPEMSWPIVEIGHLKKVDLKAGGVV